MGRLSLTEQGLIGHRQIKQISRVKSVQRFIAKNSDFPQPLYQKKRSTLYDQTAVLRWFNQHRPDDLIRLGIAVPIISINESLISRTEIGLILGTRNTLYFCNTLPNFPKPVQFNRDGYPIMYCRLEVLNWFKAYRPQCLINKEISSQRAKNILSHFIANINN